MSCRASEKDEKDEKVRRGFHCIPEEDDLSRPKEFYRKLSESFHDDGFVCISEVFPRSLVQELLDSYEASFRECFHVLHKSGRTAFPRSHSVDEASGDVVYPLGVGVKHGYREIVMRSPGRYEVTYGLTEATSPEDQPHRANAQRAMPPFDAVVLDAKVGRIVSSLFQEEREECEYYLSSLSVVTATPGCPQQGWHADGGHVNVLKHQPCHCLNVFIPLIDLTPQLGPTELRPGTHYHTRNLAPMMLAAKARKTLRSPVTPILKAGDALVFDYRILHRGLPNITTTTNRHILVMAFAKKWFVDILNFPRRSMLDEDDDGTHHHSHQLKEE